MSVTFWVRETSNNANADTLVIGNEASVQLTFTNDSPFVSGVDHTGDFLLEGGGTSTSFGTMDPDTWAVVGGTTYRIVYDATGTLPSNNTKVPESLRGDPVYVVRLYSLTDPAVLVKSYFFSPESDAEIVGSQALMNGFGNGNVRLEGENLTPPPFSPCFVADTDILTPVGLRKVESLVAGDHILTADGAVRQIIWVGSSRISHAHLLTNPALRPIVIVANAFGPGAPATDLNVSPQHRVLVEGQMCELLFGVPAALVPAKFLVGQLAKVADPAGAVEYFHILLEDHEMLVSNGLPTESFQPARRTIDVMDGVARARIEALIAALGDDRFLTRPDRHISLRAHEALVLVNWLERTGIAPAEAVEHHLVA